MSFRRSMSLRCNMTAVAASMAFATVALASVASAQVRVEQVVSPGGIRAWLMEDRSVPLITVTFAFRGGNSEDAPGREGTASFLVNTIDEGAGTLSMTEFQRKIARLGIRIGFSSTDDWLSGSFATLAENRDEAARLVRSVLMEPRLEQTSIERIRNLFVSQLAQRRKSPGSLATDRLRTVAYKGHPYSRQIGGTEQSLKAVTRADIEDYRKRVLARDTLVVSAAGAIDARELGKLLDRVFGGLPDRARISELARTSPEGAGRLEVVEIDVPQSVAVFQLPGIPIADPDYMAARMMTSILGNGGFESRLMKEIRVKRGLAYGVSATLSNARGADTWIGSVSTRNEAVAEALAVVRSELKRMAEDGPTEEELAETKSSMIGLFALNFDTIGSMASLMQSTQLSGLGIDYFERRSTMIERVTADDVKRVARRLLDPDRMLIVVAGKPAKLSQAARPN